MRSSCLSRVFLRLSWGFSCVCGRASGSAAFARGYLGDRSVPLRVDTKNPEKRKEENHHLKIHYHHEALTKSIGAIFFSKGIDLRLPTSASPETKRHELLTTSWCWIFSTS